MLRRKRVGVYEPRRRRLSRTEHRVPQVVSGSSQSYLFGVMSILNKGVKQQNLTPSITCW